MPSLYYTVGTPWGFTYANPTWPPSSGATPIFTVWDANSSSPDQVPQRTVFEIDTVPTTRVLPNGVKIRKFQTYSAPKAYPREVWSWTVRQQGHAQGRYYVGDPDVPIIDVQGHIVGIFVLTFTSATNAFVYEAQASFERLTATSDPTLMHRHVIYTAEFERLSDWESVGVFTLT